MDLSFYKGKKVLVTGHTGFKGSWLSQWLLSLGAEVIGYSLIETGNNELFDTLNLRDEIIHYDKSINDLKSLLEVFNNHQPEIVFHLAAQAIVKTSYEYPIDTFQTNVIGTLNVLESIKNCSSVQVAIMVTSDKCYKNNEKQFGFIEGDAMGGDDPYSASKACAELAIQSYVKSFFNSDINSNVPRVVSVRAGNILGGGDWSKDRLIVDCVNSIKNDKEIILRDPHAVRPWQHVLDASYAYLLIGIYAYNNSNHEKAFNVGPSEERVITVQELVDKIIQMYGKGEFKKSDKKFYHEANYLKLNVELIQKTLGWSCQFDSDRLIEKTIEWYKFAEKNTNEKIKEFTLNQIKEYFLAI
jgi:CDP-glucose 4,6-dehydratase